MQMGLPWARTGQTHASRAWQPQNCACCLITLRNSYWNMVYGIRYVSLARRAIIPYNSIHLIPYTIFAATKAFSPPASLYINQLHILLVVSFFKIMALYFSAI